MSAWAAVLSRSAQPPQTCTDSNLCGRLTAGSRLGVLLAQSCNTACIKPASPASLKPQVTKTASRTCLGHSFYRRAPWCMCLNTLPGASPSAKPTVEIATAYIVRYSGHEPERASVKGKHSSMKATGSTWTVCSSLDR